MISMHKTGVRLLPLLLLCLLPCAPARATKLNLPPEATEGLRLIYSGNPDQAIELFHKLQKEQPEHPLGYLLEANARWWRLYCEAVEIKWGMMDAWKRPRRPEDDAYLALAGRAIALAEAQLKQKETAEMRLYAGMGYALKARLLGLRDDRRGTARAGVKSRENFLRAIQLDPEMADAYTGLGLYNYYVDTLSAIAKILRFFMGIPGGNKREGMRQLETAMTRGELTAAEARFYLAKCLRNYDQQYERAAELLVPLVERYPQNPLFHLLLGDMNAKLNRKEKATASYRAAAQLVRNGEACAARLRQVAGQALAALGLPAGGNRAGAPD